MLKNYSFLIHWIVLAPLSKISWSQTYRFISRLSSISVICMSVSIPIPHCVDDFGFVVTFNIWAYESSSSPSMKAFWLCRMLFFTCWDDHVVLFFYYISILYYINWLSDVKVLLHLQDKYNLVMLCNSVYMFLDLVFHYFVGDFYIHVHEWYRFAVFL